MNGLGRDADVGLCVLLFLEDTLGSWRGNRWCLSYRFSRTAASSCARRTAESLPWAKSKGRLSPHGKAAS